MISELSLSLSLSLSYTPTPTPTLKTDIYTLYMQAVV
jgi:hypothetical protein